MNQSQFNDTLTSTCQVSSIGWALLLNQWLPDRVTPEITFMMLDKDNIVIFVLITKNPNGEALA